MELCKRLEIWPKIAKTTISSLFQIQDNPKKFPIAKHQEKGKIEQLNLIIQQGANPFHYFTLQESSQSGKFNLINFLVFLPKKKPQMPNVQFPPKEKTAKIKCLILNTKNVFNPFLFSFFHVPKITSNEVKNWNGIYMDYSQHFPLLSIFYFFFIPWLYLLRILIMFICCLVLIKINLKGPQN